MPLITLTTDFGTAAPYVAAMKGVVFSIDPEARIVDLGHDLPPQDVLHTAHFLAQSVPHFPNGTIHVCVVDPGVGTKRALLLAEAGGQLLLAPDNGVLTFAIEALGGSNTVRQLSESKFWHSNPSPTFHGRDILAPVAAHLGLGISPAQLGPPVTSWSRLTEPKPQRVAAGVQGVVVFVDGFGNLITNIPATMLAAAPARVRVGNREAPMVRTYGEALPGALVALIGSSDRLELAVVDGNAAKTLNLGVGQAVTVHLA